MMGLIGAGNNPMVGMTVACAVAVSEALNKSAFIKLCDAFGQLVKDLL